MYAYDNGLIRYGTVALCNALLIKKNCKVNDIVLATDRDTIDDLIDTHGKKLIGKAFDEILIRDSSDQSTGDRRYFDSRYSDGLARYINGDRCTSYDLSPFDETILIDVDYLMLDDTMDLTWGIKEDLLCNRLVRDLDHRVDILDTGSRIDDMGIPLYWATSVYFKKSDAARILFGYMGFIRDNYEFYRSLYNCMSTQYFRNDYAISIALHAMNGFMEIDNVKPFPIDHISVSLDYDVMHDFVDGKALITSEPEPGRFNMHLVGSNFHAMNKNNVIRNSQKIIGYATT